MFVGVLVSGLAGLASYEVGNRISTLKDKAAQNEIEGAKAELARSQKELAELKEKQAPRTISPKQRERIAKGLYGLPKPSHIVVTYDDTTHEAREFAHSIESILKEIGWRETHLAFGSSDAKANPGLFLVVQKGDESLDELGEKILQVFRQAGLPIQRLPMWHLFRHDPSIQFEIRVGQKP